MATERRHIDCDQIDGVFEHCTVRISAADDDEVVRAALEHAIHSHGQQDTPQLRERLRSAVHGPWRSY